MSLQVIVGSSRVPFLILTPICIFLGAAVVTAQGQEFSIAILLLAMLGGVLAHIAVNTLNEYEDYRSGLDLTTNRTPFSGGSGALPAHPQHLNSVLYTGVISLLLTAAIGAYFVWLRGWAILPLGLLGLAIIVLYTSWINRQPWLCLVAPGVCFGLLMVTGTQFVLTGNYDTNAFWFGLIPFALVNNLLLLNQYPDVEADIAVGRRHFPIAYGVAASNRAYAGMWFLALIVLVVSIIQGKLPAWGWLALLPLMLGAVAWFGARKYGFDLGKHPAFLGLNVVAALLTPLAVALALALAW